ncbi:LuxR C-terminal-related transcriptional regulator [Actinoplanes sp. NPDC024001]|uniref:LuxR C-terminal-related transcriptional regulator n=1 Tax=Actinoplanes sp. NPDC024001 TaxID=3154598 RepID=UPI0033E57532
MNESARADAGRPAAPQPYLRRPRLHARLDEGVTRPVTVLRAGPGWGKTTLAAAWAAEQPDPGRVAWLTVRHRHAAGAAFRSAVAAVTGADRHEPVLDRISAPLVLVLDDVHLLDGAPARQALAALVAHPPVGLRLVLLCRGEPPLPRADAHTIGMDELAFDDAEAADLVALFGGGDPTAGEGWPLGLRLAAESDSSGALDDYLWREVVAVQPPAVRRFLLRTSIVSRFTPALAEELTGTLDSASVLDRLARDTGLVSGDGHFRYHRQLRAMLARRLEVEAPDQAVRLHGVAARWYAAQFAVPEALAHAGDAGDWVHLGRLVAELAVTRIVSAERRMVVDAVQRIPPEFLPTTAELSLCAALVMFFTGDFAAIPSWIERSRAMLADRDPADRLPVDAALSLLEIGTVHRVRGDMAKLVTAATEVLGRLATADSDHLPQLPQLSAVAVNNKGVGLLWTGRLDQAEECLRSALRAARTTGLELIELNASGHLALIAYFRGDLGTAERYAGAARQLAERLGLSTTAQAAAGQLTLALIEVERDRVAEARAHLRQILHIEAHPPEAAIVMMSSVVIVHLLLDAGEAVAARPFPRQARREHVYAQDAPFLQRWMDLLESEIDLALDAPATVVARYRERPAPMPAEQVMLGRALVATGDSSGEQLLTAAADGPDRIAAVQACVSLALLADDRGQKSRAAAAVARAVALAEPDGIRRPFRRLRPTGLDPVPGHRPPELSPPLTERETEVLRFLPSVLTAQEIAENLGVSITTIKAHLRSIYRKLGASRRREAVDIARRLDLL